MREGAPSRKSALQPGARRVITPLCVATESRSAGFARSPRRALALSALTVGCQAAELPSQARKAKPPETAAAKKCNIGGIAGVVAANGVCVRLSGSISASFGAAQLK